MKTSAVLSLLAAGTSVLGAPAKSFEVSARDVQIAPRDDDIFSDCGNVHPNYVELRQVFWGNQDRGGEICGAAYKAGVFPNSIEAQYADQKVRYLKVGYTDGSFKTVGKTVDGAEKGQIKWNPYRDTFSKFGSVTMVDGNGGVGGMNLELKGCDRGDGSPCWLTLGLKADEGGDSPQRGTGNSGMMLGFVATGGDRLDSFRSIWTTSGVDKAMMTKPTFSPTLEELNDMQPGQNGLERKVAINIVDNRNSTTEATIKYQSGRTVKKQTKVSVTNEEGIENGFEAGTTMKFETSFDIPVIGSASAGLEQSLKFDKKTTKKTIENKEDMEAVDDVVTFGIDKTVKPGTLLEATSVAVQATLDLDFDATLEIILNNRDKMEFPIRGTFKEADYSEFTTTYAEYDGDKVGEETEKEIENATRKRDLGEADVVVITKRDDEKETTVNPGEGAFCPDGSRAGEFGMSKPDFIKACNLF